MTAQSCSGKDIVHVPSKYSVSETLQPLQSLVKSRGLMLFAHIDFRMGELLVTGYVTATRTGQTSPICPHLGDTLSCGFLWGPVV